MRLLTAIVLCTGGLLTCGASTSEACFFGWGSSYSCCYGGCSTCYRPVTACYVSSAACCPTTACYSCPTTSCCPTNCCPTGCSSCCPSGTCSGAGCSPSDSSQGSTYSATLRPRRQVAPVQSASSQPVAVRKPVKRPVQPLRTVSAVSPWTPVKQAALVKTASAEVQAPSTGWEPVR